MVFDRWSTSKFSSERARDLANDLDLFRHELCVHWGFCNWLHGSEMLNEGAITAEEFADHVLRGEGIDPTNEPNFQKVIRRAFVERYGLNKVSTETYVTQTP